MATRGNQAAKEEALAALLAVGSQIDQAADQLNIGRRTAYRWWARDDFRSRVTKLRARMTDQAVARVAASLDKAAGKLDKLLDSGDLKVQLQAVRTAMASGLKAVELARVVDRLEELERTIKDLEGSRNGLEGPGRETEEQG